MPETLYNDTEHVKKREYMREWNKNNKDKVSAINRRATIKRHVKKKEYDVIYRAENKERAAIYQAKYYKDNKERIVKRCSKWLKENADKHLTYVHKRRAAIKSSGGSFTKKEWDTLKKKYGNKCLSCGKTDVKLSPDHVIPLARGGSGKIENIQPLCVSCNCSKGAKSTDYR